MNKFLTIAFFSLIFASCKKDYTCACTQVYYQPITSNGQPYTSVSTFSNVFHAKEDEAKASCDALNTVTSDATSTTTISCEFN